jgi:hypothetical protein
LFDRGTYEGLRWEYVVVWVKLSFLLNATRVPYVELDQGGEV